MAGRKGKESIREEGVSNKGLLARAKGKLSEKLVGKLVLPAQLRDPAAQPANTIVTNAVVAEDLEDSVEITSAPIEFQDFELDNFIIKNTDSDPRPQLVIYCLGNTSYSSDRSVVNEALRDLQELNCHVACVDYPGSGFYKKPHQRAEGFGQVVDAEKIFIEHVIQILDTDIEYADIIIKGHSLGGSVAVRTAAELHAEGKPVSAFSGRSFADIGKVVGVPGTNSALSGLSNWKPNVIPAWESIPPECRDYITAYHIDKKGNKVASDGVIPLSASLHAHHLDKLFTLKNALEKTKARINKSQGGSSSSLFAGIGEDLLQSQDEVVTLDSFLQGKALYDLTPDEIEVFNILLKTSSADELDKIDQLIEMADMNIQQIKDNHLFSTNTRGKQTHNVDLRTIKNNSGMQAEEKFHFFAHNRHMAVRPEPVVPEDEGDLGLGR